MAKVREGCAEVYIISQKPLNKEASKDKKEPSLFYLQHHELPTL
jgi:hypothetical protein